MALVFYRSPGEGNPGWLSDDQLVRLILRPDVEDRSFHDTTKAYTGPEHLFPSALTAHKQGFDFTPASDRRLEMAIRQGTFVHETQWHYMVHRPLEAERGLDPDSVCSAPVILSLP